MARKNAMKNDSSSITFNTRTKAVMADIVQDNVKEKVTAVREVVSGKSNNEIILVLQYYDYDVEKAIQAYVEDGAKSALTDWQHTGSKAPRKKNKKKRQQQQQQQQQQNGPKSPQSVSSESSVKTNGDIGDMRLEPPIVNGILHIENDISKQTTSVPDFTNHVRPSSPTLSEMSSVDGSNHILENGPSEIKIIETPQPEPHPQHAHNHHHRQRTHSGSHSHGHKHDHDRNRTTSTSSIPDDSKARAKRTAHGLEKSVKDLHRQTVSLDRLKLVFNDEVEKAYKRIRVVFDEMRNCLNAREAELVKEMGCVKTAAADTFAMRQTQAVGLKVKIDRADRLDDSQLADLRAEIKHFVSDRKIDEDLGRTTRFLYDNDHLKDEVKKFGEIVPVKCAYGNPHLSVSSSMSEQDQHLPASPSVDTSASTALTSTSSHTTEKPNVPHLDRTEAHEVAELQKRLKNSLTLEGIAVETYPDRPVSAPVSTDDQPSRPNRPDSAFGRNRNRNQRRPQDQGRDRPRDNRNGTNDGRQIYNQGASGERVILIGRGTRPQSSQPRGRGRGGYGGRGRGGNPGGYAGNPGGHPTPLIPREASNQEKGDTSSSQESKSLPPRGQRSPRRGRGGASGRGRGGGASSTAQDSSRTQSQDNQSSSSQTSTMSRVAEVNGQ